MAIEMRAIVRCDNCADEIELFNCDSLAEAVGRMHDAGWYGDGDMEVDWHEHDAAYLLCPECV